MRRARDCFAKSNLRQLPRVHGREGLIASRSTARRARTTAISVSVQAEMDEVANFHVRALCQNTVDDVGQPTRPVTPAFAHEMQGHLTRSTVEHVGPNHPPQRVHLLARHCQAHLDLRVEAVVLAQGTRVVILGE